MRKLDVDIKINSSRKSEKKKSFRFTILTETSVFSSFLSMTEGKIAHLNSVCNKKLH